MLPWSAMGLVFVKERKQRTDDSKEEENAFAKSFCLVFSRTSSQESEQQCTASFPLLTETKQAKKRKEAANLRFFVTVNNADKGSGDASDES